MLQSICSKATPEIERKFCEFMTTHSFVLNIISQFITKIFLIIYRLLVKLTEVIIEMKKSPGKTYPKVLTDEFGRVLTALKQLMPLMAETVINFEKFLKYFYLKKIMFKTQEETEQISEPGNVIMVSLEYK